MYAIVETGGKQFQVKPGDVLDVEKLNAGEGDEITLDQVLLIRDGENLQIGKPRLENASVKAKVLGQGRGKKIKVFKFKKRKQYRRTQGHRQYLTRIKIEEIVAG